MVYGEQESVDALQTALLSQLEVTDEGDLHYWLGEALLEYNDDPVMIREGIYHLVYSLRLLSQSSEDNTYGRAKLKRNCLSTAMRLRQIRNGRRINVSHDLVIDICEIAVKLDYENYLPWSLLSQEFAETMQYKKGLETGLKALELNPRDSYAHNAVAKCYEGIGEVDKARHHFMLRARLQNTPDGYRIVTDYLERMGEVDSALDMARSWLDLEPKNPIAYQRVEQLSDRLGSQEYGYSEMLKQHDGSIKRKNELEEELLYRAVATGEN
ncbi:MAG: hypothetical protein PHD88_02325 [Firmicutes bacterium]|nr:hypothetical protein [Bacillota bacterium]MDD4264629.1 hypothetical protein [Bacillota bacterium]MDD4693228.1 hypothetical protein [Bacillota bacterium]